MSLQLTKLKVIPSSLWSAAGSQTSRSLQPSSNANNTSAMFHTHKRANTNHTARTFTTSTSNATPAVSASSSSPSSSLPVSSSSSRNSHSSSNSSSKSFLLLGVAGLSSLYLALSGNTVNAESVELPTVPLDVSSSPSSASSSASNTRKKKKKRSGQRKKLDYPGKFGNMHRDAQQLVQVQVSQGVKWQIPIGVFPPDPQSEKTCVLIPMGEFGGAAGPLGQLVVQTNLGRNHKFEAYMDTATNSQGSYKYVSDSGFSVKPSAQVTQNGNGVSIDFDYKGKESATTATIGNFQELSLSYNQSLTPTLIGGVELHYGLMSFAHVNGAVKYTPDSSEQYVVSKRDSKYTASYLHKLYEGPHVAAHQGYPPLSTHVGLETSFSSASQKSDVAVGLRHARHSYNWHAMVSSAPFLAVAFDTELMTGNPGIRWGANAQINYDGSGESQVGLSFVAQF